VISKSLAEILTINAGSSSIKMALYEMNERAVLKLSCKIESIENKNTNLTIKENNTKNEFKIDATDFYSAILLLIEWLEKQNWFESIKAIGHRIVHGMHHTKSEIINDNLLHELNSIVDYDPDHLPVEIEIIKLIKQKHSQLLQVACFDTAFHTTIPAVAKTFAIPKKYFGEGIRRYGFHGISYNFLMEELRKQNEAEANSRIIIAHLGSGASIAAIKNGKCIDTSMGFTPAAGIVMSSRSGDIDPGVAWYLMQKGMDAKKFNHLINHQSGLLGISGISADMQELLQQKNNKDAVLAIDIFCYQIKKFIGAYTAALGGLDVLIFSGGIGENASQIRACICKDFDYLNIELNEEKNNKNERQISSDNSTVKVYVIPTNEELMIAKDTAKLYRASQNK
jgi:acetate kinase